MQSICGIYSVRVASICYAGCCGHRRPQSVVSAGISDVHRIFRRVFLSATSRGNERSVTKRTRHWWGLPINEYSIECAVRVYDYDWTPPRARQDFRHSRIEMNLMLWVAANGCVSVGSMQIILATIIMRNNQVVFIALRNVITVGVASITARCGCLPSSVDARHGSIHAWCSGIAIIFRTCYASTLRILNCISNVGLQMCCI